MSGQFFVTILVTAPKLSRYYLISTARNFGSLFVMRNLQIIYKDVLLLDILKFPAKSFQRSNRMVISHSVKAQMMISGS